MKTAALFPLISSTYRLTRWKESKCSRDFRSASAKVDVHSTRGLIQLLCSIDHRRSHQGVRRFSLNQGRQRVVNPPVRFISPVDIKMGFLSALFFPLHILLQSDGTPLEEHRRDRQRPPLRCCKLKKKRRTDVFVDKPLPFSLGVR